MYLNKSRGRKRFKADLGNANHLIITSLVGLNAIERGIIDSIPPEMRMTWSPKSAKDSAQRARRFVLDMTFIRTVDAIDIYLRDAMRKPRLIQKQEVQSRMDQAGRSISGKINELKEIYKGLDPLLYSMVELLVIWRNKSAHGEASEDLNENTQAVIRNNHDLVSSWFSGLDTEVLLKNFDREKPPTFKEVASFINVSHRFIQDLELQLFNNLDEIFFLRELVERAVRTNRINDIWGRDPCDRPRYVRSLLQHNGLARTKAKNGPCFEFSPEIIEQISEFDPKSLKEWLSDPTLPGVTA